MDLPHAVPAKNGPEVKPASLQAGYGRENITPDKPMGLDGYGDQATRKSGTVLDYLYTTCVAFSEGEQTILVYTVDICSLADNQMDALRAVVTTATGVPGENICFGATHTHSGVRLEGNQEYEQQLYTACVNAAKTAIADLAPVKMEAGTAMLEGLNFVRHYLMNDGTYEMFSDHSNFVKENSPFDFLITGNSSYIPSAEAYDYRSYEADTGFYAQGTGEQLAKEYVNLLNTLK